MRKSLLAASAVLSLAITLATASPASARHRLAPVPGSPGIGDSYYPDYGNGGYDVAHYDIRLRYRPDSDLLTGTTTILARATQDLSRFNLDFVLDTATVRVNNRAATFAREGDHELVVTPARPILAGQLMTIVVQYSGVPSTKVAAGFTAWTRTTDGALAVGQPQIAWWWYPSNDHPKDKATFDISVSVPNGVEVLSNGVMPRPPLPELIGWTRWSWRMTTPAATYLAFLAIGQFEITTDTAANGQQIINAYAEGLGEIEGAARSSIERTAEVVEFLEGFFGPYPVDAQGGVVVRLGQLGFALETQTRSVYDGGFWRRGSNMYVVVHENAHQWVGDSVAIDDWKHIWLNEGFATYAEWLWSEAVGEGTAQEVFDFTYAFYPEDGGFWQVLPGDPGPENQFDIAVYDRGAMTLHQLRLLIGDEAFFGLVRTWLALHRNGDVNTDEFIALAEQVSGQELSAFFDTWLFTPARPAVGGEAAAARTAAVVAEPKSWAKIQLGRELRIG